MLIVFSKRKVVASVSIDEVGEVRAQGAGTKVDILTFKLLEYGDISRMRQWSAAVSVVKC